MSRTSNLLTCLLTSSLNAFSHAVLLWSSRLRNFTLANPRKLSYTTARSYKTKRTCIQSNHNYVIFAELTEDFQLVNQLKVYFLICYVAAALLSIVSSLEAIISSLLIKRKDAIIQLQSNLNLQGNREIRNYQD